MEWIQTIFQASRNVDVAIEVLNKFVKTGAITLAANLIYFTGVLWEGVLFAGIKFCILSYTYSVETGCRKKKVCSDWICKISGLALLLLVWFYLQFFSLKIQNVY